jgi:hypothetical protein
LIINWQLSNCTQLNLPLSEYGGPILDFESDKPKGSVLHLLYGPVFDSIDKVKAFLEADPFIANEGESDFRVYLTVG